jgi:hypothetical protein
LMIHLFPSTMAVVEHIIITTVSLRISRTYHFVLYSSVTWVHHSARVHRHSNARRSYLRWPLGHSTAPIWFIMSYRFDLTRSWNSRRESPLFLSVSPAVRSTSQSNHLTWLVPAWQLTGP